MQMHYANEVNSLSVHLPSQYAYPFERNFTVNRLHKRKNCLSRVSLNLTAMRCNDKRFSCKFKSASNVWLLIRWLKKKTIGYPVQSLNLLNDLNWHSLELRRKIARLTTMYKIVNNKIRVNIPKYIAHPTRVTRSYYSSKFINIGSNSNT